MIRLAFGIVCLAYAVGGYAYSAINNADIGPLWWLQFSTIVCIGLVAVLSWGLPHIISYVKTLSFGPEEPKPNVFLSTGNCAGSISPEEQQDISAIYHLAGRLKGNDEGVKLCKQLHDLLFMEVHHKEKESE